MCLELGLSLGNNIPSKLRLLTEIHPEFSEAKMEIYQLMKYKGRLYKQTTGMTMGLGNDWNQELHLCTGFILSAQRLLALPIWWGTRSKTTLVFYTLPFPPSAMDGGGWHKQKKGQRRYQTDHSIHIYHKRYMLRDNQWEMTQDW